MLNATDAPPRKFKSRNVPGLDVSQKEMRVAVRAARAANPVGLFLLLGSQATRTSDMLPRHEKPRVYAELKALAGVA